MLSSITATREQSFGASAGLTRKEPAMAMTKAPRALTEKNREPEPMAAALAKTYNDMFLCARTGLRITEFTLKRYFVAAHDGGSGHASSERDIKSQDLDALIERFTCENRNTPLAKALNRIKVRKDGLLQKASMLPEPGAEYYAFMVNHLLDELRLLQDEIYFAVRGIHAEAIALHKHEA